jgi:hypothetical protein
MLTFLNVVLVLSVAVFASMPFVFIWAAYADDKDNNSIPPQIDLWNNNPHDTRPVPPEIDLQR